MTGDRQPSVNRTAFECPHCGVFTTQFWVDLYAKSVKTDSGEPVIFRESEIESLFLGMIPGLQDKVESVIRRSASGEIFTNKADTCYSEAQFHNLHASQCYACDKFAVWRHDRLIYPSTRTGPAPNAELPDDIRADFEEARTILELSPRGSAALLRLSVQKLCQHLLKDDSGKDLNADIGKLVDKGLNPLVQKSLDAIRVIGNNAVHPGVLDLKDDHDTTLKLFDLVNLIADQMISQPKVVDRAYEDLVPDGAKQAIERRDG